MVAKSIEEARAKVKAEEAKKRADKKRADELAKLQADLAQKRANSQSAARSGFNERAARLSREADKIQAQIDQIAPVPKPDRPATPAVTDPTATTARRAQTRLAGQEPQSLAPEKRAPVDGDVASRIIAAAESSLGVAYRWGGNSLASGVDCSGLVQQAFRAAGINLPRVSADQARLGMTIGSLAEAQPGDLISYDNSNRNNGADHIAIYVGNGKMIEAPKTGGVVQVVDVREGGSINRVIGQVEARPGVAMPALGPNKDRSLAAAVKSGAAFTSPPSPTGGPSVEMGGGFGDDLPPDASPADVEAYVMKHYPLVAGFLANPELRKVLFDAAKSGDDATQVQEAIRGTNYWKTQGESGSAFDLLIAKGGPEAERLVGQTKNLVGDLFSQFGLPLDDETLGTVAKNAIRFGWVNLSGQLVQPQSLNDFVAMTARSKGGVPDTGSLAVSSDSLGRIAKTFYVPMTKQDLDEWTLKILEGTATEDTFTQYVKTLAKGRFVNDPNMLSAMDKGLTPDDYLKPFRNTIANTLELSPDQVDLFGDSKFSGALQVWDDKAKAMRPANLSETAQWARNQDQYKNTTTYRQQDANFGMNIAELFGKAK